MLRALFVILIVIAVALGGAFVVAGRGAPPQLTIAKPDRFVGQTGALEVTADAPKARFTTLSVALEQNGKSTPLYTLGPGPAPAGVTVTPVDAHRLRITRAIGKRDLPDLQAGPARIVVTATRPSFLNL